MTLKPTLILLLLGLFCTIVSPAKLKTKDSLLHISMEPEYLFKYKDEVYVRFYQTVYHPLDDLGVSETEFLSKYKGKGPVYKDIWKDKNGRVIIMPGYSPKKGLVKESWFGVGDFRNQVKFMYNYRNQGATTPVIRSFLVNYDAIELMMDKSRITDEHHRKTGSSFNVDQYFPNQFKISEFDMEEIQRNILPDSLVSYVFDPEQIPDERRHWGLKLGMEELFHELGISQEIPGIQRDRTTRENIRDYLDKLLDIKERPQSELEKTFKDFSGMEESHQLDKATTKKLKDRVSTILSDFELEPSVKAYLKKFEIMDVEKSSNLDETAIKKLIQLEVEKIFEDFSTKYQNPKQHKAAVKMLKGKVFKLCSKVELEKIFKGFLSKYKNGMFDVEKIPMLDEPAIKNLKKKIQKSLKFDKDRALLLGNMKDDLSQIHTMKEELQKLELKADGDPYTDNRINKLKTDISEKTSEYNNKYMPKEIWKDQYHLKETADIGTINAWREECGKRNDINNRRYEDGGKSIFEVKPKRKLPLGQIKSLETDHMYSKTGRSTNDMPQLMKRTQKFNADFENSKSFFTLVEVFCKKLPDVTPDGKVYSSVRKLTPKELLKRAFPNEPLFVAKLESRFFADGIDIQKYMTEINENFAKYIQSPEARDNMQNKMKEVMKDIEKSKKPPKYSTEIIVQYGDDTEVNKASSYLKNRYLTEDKTVVHIRFDKNGLIKSDLGTWNDMVMNEKTRITVVGHGQSTNDGLNIGGKSPSILAKNLVEDVIVNNGNEMTIGKISLVACNENSQTLDGINFGRKLVEILDNDNINSVVSVRNGKVQITDDGMKVYGDGTEFHLRKRPPLIIKETNDGVQYGVINMKTKAIEYTPEIPDFPQNEKILVVSKNHGPNFEYDAKLNKLSSIENLNGKHLSGPLEFYGQDIMTSLDSDDLKEQSKIYLDSDIKPEKVSSLDTAEVDSALLQLEARDSVTRLSVATKEALDLIPDTNSENWVPIIDSAETATDGKTKVIMLNTDTMKTHEVKMNNDAFTQFKKKSKRLAMNVDSLPTFSKTSIGMSGTGSLLGLGGFIYSAIQMSRAKKCINNVTCPATKEARQLAKALEINAYISMSEGAFGVVTDSVQIAELVVGFKLSKNAVNGVATMSKATVKFLKVSKVLGNIGTGVGAVGSIVSLGFSSYQLHHAQTKAQKIEYGIQVGIDSLNLAVTGVAIGTAIAATVTTSATISAIASAAGPVGFAVAIVGILVSTITSLVFEFKNTRKNADMVGEYFFNLSQVYSQDGIEFNSSTGMLTVLNHAIIKEIDFERGRIVLDSQYIYRTKHGSSGSGKINYFFWVGHFPKMIEDKSQAINIRHGIGYSPSTIYKYYIRNTKQLILPAIPKSYISYEYSRLPGCTTMNDKGFSIMRRLEKDYRFDYDFYICPGEQIVSSISHEYVHTRVTLKLTSDIKVIVSQRVQDSFLQNKYTFHLITRSTHHTILISDGYTYELESRSQCSWNIDYEGSFDSITFSSGYVRFGKANVRVIKPNDYLYVSDAMGGILRIDAHKRLKAFVSVVHKTQTTTEELKRYLRNSKKWLKDQKYVIVRNFSNKGTYIGKAFYEVESDKLLFSNYEEARVSDRFKENVQLLGRNKNNVYFMSEEITEGKITVSLWRTDAATKRIMATYNLYCGEIEFKLTKFNMQEHAVLLIQNVFDVSLVYMIYPEEIKLIYIDGKIDDIYKLGQTCFPTLNTFLPKMARLRTGQFPGKCLYASTIPVMPIKQTLPNRVIKHYWLYMKESYPPEHNFDTVFCESNKPPVATGIIKPNITDECEDLSLRDIQTLHSGEEIYYFMCEKDKIIYYQKAKNPAREVIVPGGLDRIEDYENMKLIKSHNGGIYKFTKFGNFSFMAFSFEHISNDEDWVKRFKALAVEELVETLIPVLHIENIDRKNVIAWFDVSLERFIIVSPSFDADDVSYIGPSPSLYLVWLYSENKQQVMLQRVLNEQEILDRTIIRDSKPVWGDRISPVGEIVLDNVNSAEYMQGGVFAVLNDGVMVHVDHIQAINLLGVNSTWLKSNQVNLKDSLSEVCKKYNSHNIITLGSENIKDNKIIHKWYHCAIQSQVSLTVQENTEVTYLGINKHDKLLYFTLDDQLIKIDSNVTQVLPKDRGYSIVCKIMMAELKGKTLLLQPSDSYLLDDIPMLDNISSLVMAMDYGLEVILKPYHWLHYESIVVTHIGSSGPQISYLTIHPPYHCSYELEQFENYTIISDPISNRKIILEDFTRQLGKMDEDYLPNGNEAVLNVQVCDHDPVIFVSNTDRNPPIVQRMVQKNEVSKGVGALVINVYTVGVIFIVCVVFLMSTLVVVKYKRARKNGQHIVRGRNHIRVDDQPKGEETSI